MSIHYTLRRAAVGASVLGLSALTVIGAQQPKQASTPAAFNRSAIPAPASAPELHVPTWTTMKLNNGAELIVSPRHNLPLVSFAISFVGGSNQYEPAAKPGVGEFAGAMLTEGTTTKSGDDISNALQLLGTGVRISVGGENGAISFLATTDKVEKVLQIVEDLLVNPSFPNDAIERYRARRLVALTQAKDRTGSIAARVFPKVLFTEAHPYGRSVTEQSVHAITRDDIVSFAKAYFTPGHAIISVVGDVDPNEVRQLVERVLAPWSSGGSMPTFDYPQTSAPKTTTIYLVDKPGAAQSSFAIGLPGPARNTSDYFALEVLNTMLGGMFQSRLNANIREQKGYSYGVGSGFSYGKGPGPFEAGGDIVTAKSDSALIEFMKELRGIRGARPVTDDELKTAEDNLVQGLPQSFSSVRAVNSSISDIFIEQLPQDYYQHYAQNVRAVTKEDVTRVANKYIDVDHLAIVIVGDRKT
ncbi:MAG TPA: pitrilysin family protein, partial [Gemmatimonadaceae bacterium]|nr:pitrilysin family protein [Gemmatimonadaceae bacterium]